MFNKIADWLIKLAKKTPYFHIRLPNGALYMERYWLIPYNRFFPAARIHIIRLSDTPRAFHDHPWPYLTIILQGGYTEVKPVFDKSGLYQGDSRVYYGAGSVLFRRSKSWHRLEVAEGESATTLFITGRYMQKWGFMANPKTKVAYTEYLESKK